MSKARKCDNCGAYQEYEAACVTVVGKNIAGLLSTFDLCDACLRAMEVGLQSRQEKGKNKR